MTGKKKMTGLFVDNPETPEGKYLVKRRDGTVPAWPSFVLGAADPIAEVALRAYAGEVSRLLYHDAAQAEALGLSWPFYEALMRRADQFKAWRMQHGQGDPGMGPHRVDDPATIAEMRKGQAS